MLYPPLENSTTRIDIIVPMASSVTVFSIPIVWSEIIIVIGSAQFTAARDLRLAIECSRCGCCRGCVIRDGMSWIATGKVATVARIVSGSWIVVAATSTIKLLTALLFHLKWKTTHSYWEIIEFNNAMQPAMKSCNLTKTFIQNYHNIMSINTCF